MSIGLQRLLRFLIVGGVGFLVDAGVLTLLAEHLGWPLLVARAVSFACASMVTWLLNRSLVFGDRKAARSSGAAGTRDEYLRYMAVQTAGAATNLLVFFIVIWAMPQRTLHVAFPLAIGAVVAAGVTYTLLNTWLYRPRTQGTS